MEIWGPAPTPAGVADPPLTERRGAVLGQLRDGPPGQTVVGLAQRMSLHANTVREHLDALVALGLASRELAAPDGRGRPAWRYSAVDRQDLDVRVRDYVGLATALARHLVRRSEDPSADAVAAGHDWGRELVAAEPPARSQPAARRTVVTLLSDLGFAPAENRGATVVRLRQCPLLTTARELPDVVCSVHLGIVRGALDGLEADGAGTSLEAFAEPGACVLRMDAGAPGA